MRRALAIALLAALFAATALAASSITKHTVAAVAIPAGATRSLSVPYPDALEYGNARYLGRHRLAREPGAGGAAPNLAKVTILEAQSVEGGSLYMVRAHNANAHGSAPVRLTLTAITVEPLPHS
jgi:hypothetical protein